MWPLSMTTLDWKLALLKFLPLTVFSDRNNCTYIIPPDTPLRKHFLKCLQTSKWLSWVNHRPHSFMYVQLTLSILWSSVWHFYRFYHSNFHFHSVFYQSLTPPCKGYNDIVELLSRQWYWCSQHSLSRAINEASFDTLLAYSVQNLALSSTIQHASDWLNGFQSSLTKLGIPFQPYIIVWGFRCFRKGFSDLFA